MSAAPLAAALLAAGLAMAGCLPGRSMPAGSRQVVITVDNQSPLGATIEVAPMGLGGQIGRPVGPARWVGVAEPGSVPPGRHPVSFLVPPTSDWAIYANGGELIGPLDIGSHLGTLPIEIVIMANGDPAWTSPGDWP